ncbi:MAG TPA: histidine phosphatase family protein [Deltaproteobacteria bacterium]|nr:histidine phosphatase family protein [Deltaproteobacteria bacterium]
MWETRTPLLLVRHGETSWNAEGRWQGHADPELTPRGRAQADELARALAAEQGSPWTRIIASDLARARQTAEIVADLLSLPLELDPRLRELDVGAWSGLSREEIERIDAETLRAFERGEPTIRPGGGESRLEIRERTHAFVSDLTKHRAGDGVILVTHLGVIRALLPGASPTHAEKIEALAEEIAARPIDRHRRPEDGVL